MTKIVPDQGVRVILLLVFFVFKINILKNKENKFRILDSFRQRNSKINFVVVPRCYKCIIASEIIMLFLSEKNFFDRISY